MGLPCPVLKQINQRTEIILRLEEGLSPVVGLVTAFRRV